MDPLVFRLRAFLGVMLLFLAVGAVCFAVVENRPLSEALYFSLVTITTVGYGDVTPATTAGRYLAMIMIIGGVGTFTGLVANATELLVSRRDKQVRLKKQNIIIGLFFSEVGSDLLTWLARACTKRDRLARLLAVKDNWADAQFDQAEAGVKEFKVVVDIRQVDLPALHAFLTEKGGTLLRLLESPTLMEREAFTDVLQSVFHVREELYRRKSLTGLPKEDLDHLAGDATRAFNALIPMWLFYIRHLKLHYPYLFRLAIRYNPFVPQSKAED